MLETTITTATRRIRAPTKPTMRKPCLVWSVVLLLVVVQVGRVLYWSIVTRKSPSGGWAIRQQPQADSSPTNATTTTREPEEFSWLPPSSLASSFLPNHHAWWRSPPRALQQYLRHQRQLQGQRQRQGRPPKSICRVLILNSQHYHAEVLESMVALVPRWAWFDDDNKVCLQTNQSVVVVDVALKADGSHWRHYFTHVMQHVAYRYPHHQPPYYYGTDDDNKNTNHSSSFRHTTPATATDNDDDHDADLRFAGRLVSFHPSFSALQYIRDAATRSDLQHAYGSKRPLSTRPYHALMEASCYCHDHFIQWMMMSSSNDKNNNKNHPQTPNHGCFFHRPCPQLPTAVSHRAIYTTPYAKVPARQTLFPYVLPRVMKQNPPPAHSQSEISNHTTTILHTNHHTPVRVHPQTLLPTTTGPSSCHCPAIINNKTTTTTICVVGNFRRRHMSYLQAFLSRRYDTNDTTHPTNTSSTSTSNDATKQPQVSIRLLGQGTSLPSSLQPYAPEYVQIVPHVQHFEQFAEAVGCTCDSLVTVLQSRDNRAYFTTQLTGSLPQAAAYHIPLVVHERLAHVYHAYLPPLYETHADDTDSFVRALERLLERRRRQQEQEEQE